MDSTLQKERAFWRNPPLDNDPGAEPFSREHLRDVERQRYTLQPHILEVLDRIDWRGKQVLEVGTEVGTDARAIISRGGVYTGIDIDQRATEATARALRTFTLAGTTLRRDVTSLDFPDGSFDVVYAFGVLHHVRNVGKAMKEIHRVLRPGGEVIAMLFNRNSINYQLEIKLLRKLGLRLLWLPGVAELSELMGLPKDLINRKRELLRDGVVSESDWLNRNCNGSDRTFTRVYDAEEAKQLFAGFEVEQNEVHFFDHRHWGVLGSLLPKPARRMLGRQWGWHRIVHARKV